jgi:hypothetical protein
MAAPLGVRIPLTVGPALAIIMAAVFSAVERAHRLRTGSPIPWTFRMVLPKPGHTGDSASDTNHQPLTTVRPPIESTVNRVYSSLTFSGGLHEASLPG